MAMTPTTHMRTLTATRSRSAARPTRRASRCESSSVETSTFMIAQPSVTLDRFPKSDLVYTFDAGLRNDLAASPDPRAGDDSG